VSVVLGLLGGLLFYWYLQSSMASANLLPRAAAAFGQPRTSGSGAQPVVDPPSSIPAGSVSAGMAPAPVSFAASSPDKVVSSPPKMASKKPARSSSKGSTQVSPKSGDDLGNQILNKVVPDAADSLLHKLF
jgi:hypothetical protein